jgi:hypothetical protein
MAQNILRSLVGGRVKREGEPEEPLLSSPIIPISTPENAMFPFKEVEAKN